MENNISEKELRKLMKVSQYGLWRWTDVLDYDFEPIALKDIKKKDVPIVLHCTRGLMKKSLYAEYVPGRYLNKIIEDVDELLPF